MLRFSLVVATVNRTDELAQFLRSAAQQNRTDIEVIVVDQNDDDCVTRLLNEIPVSFPVRVLRFTEKNVSAARNAGMDVATGEIIAFPDDDCWYPAGLLEQVDAWFRANSAYSVLAVGAVDDVGIPSGNRWLQDECDITAMNSLRTTFCSSLFISAVERSKEVRFDHKLSRGEETDFILRLLATGLRGRFDRRMYIHHPRRDMLSGTVSRIRARSYGAGMGRLVRRHSLFFLWFCLFVYDLMRVVLVAIRGQFTSAMYCLAHAEGLFRGFFLPETEL